MPTTYALGYSKGYAKGIEDGKGLSFEMGYQKAKLEMEQFIKNTRIDIVGCIPKGENKISKAISCANCPLISSMKDINAKKLCLKCAGYFIITNHFTPLNTKLESNDKRKELGIHKIGELFS